MTDESWNRIPQAKVRIPESGLKSLLEGLGPDGFAVSYRNKIELVEDGIYVTLETNVGKYPHIVPFPIEVFIPVPQDQMPKAKPNEEEANSGDIKGTSEQKTSGTEPSLGDSTGEVITMASDGDVGRPTGLSGGFGDSQPQRGDVDNGGPIPSSGDAIQSSVGKDVSNTQPVIS